MAKGDSVLSVRFYEKPGYGGIKRAIIECDFDGNNYATGGYDFDITGYGLGTILTVDLPSSVLGYVPEYDSANDKLLFRWVDTTVDGAPLDEVADDDTLVKDEVIYVTVTGIGV